MRKRPLNDLLDRMAPVARRIILTACTPDCCIATGAILKRVFEAYHYTPEAIPCQVHLMNARMATAYDTGEIPSAGAVATDKWMRATGAYALAITPESAKVSAMNGVHGFGGHLLLRVKDVLIDASLDQASRPQANIEVPPFFVFPCLAEFMGGKAISWEFPKTGTVVTYQRLRDYSFRSAPDWWWNKKKQLYYAVVSQIIHAIEGADANAG